MLSDDIIDNERVNKIGGWTIGASFISAAMLVAVYLDIWDGKKTLESERELKKWLNSVEPEMVVDEIERSSNGSISKIGGYQKSLRNDFVKFDFFDEFLYARLFPDNKYHFARTMSMHVGEYERNSISYCWEGRTKNEKPVGKGVARYFEGNTPFIFSGTINNGFFDWTGDLYFPDRSYTGTWVNGKLEGPVRITYKDKKSDVRYIDIGFRENQPVGAGKGYDKDWIPIYKVSMQGSKMNFEPDPERLKFPQYAKSSETWNLFSIAATLLIIDLFLRSSDGNNCVCNNCFSGTYVQDGQGISCGQCGGDGNICN